MHPDQAGVSGGFGISAQDHSLDTLDGVRRHALEHRLSYPQVSHAAPDRRAGCVQRRGPVEGGGAEGELRTHLQVRQPAWHPDPDPRLPICAASPPSATISPARCSTGRTCRLSGAPATTATTTCSGNTSRDRHLGCRVTGPAPRERPARGALHPARPYPGAPGGHPEPEAFDPRPVRRGQPHLEALGDSKPQAGLRGHGHPGRLGAGHAGGRGQGRDGCHRPGVVGPRPAPAEAGVVGRGPHRPDHTGPAHTPGPAGGPRPADHRGTAPADSAEVLEVTIFVAG